MSSHTSGPISRLSTTLGATRLRTRRPTLQQCQLALFETASSARAWCGRIGVVLHGLDSYNPLQIVAEVRSSALQTGGQCRFKASFNGDQLFAAGTVAESADSTADDAEHHHRVDTD